MGAAGKRTERVYTGSIFSCADGLDYGHRFFDERCLQYLIFKEAPAYL